MSKGFGTPASVPASATIKKLKRSLINPFESLEDPRVRQAEHLLLDIVAIAILAVISGADDMVAVETYGIGMSADTQAQIFDPFFTTKPIGVGTGMGLSISYQIVTGNHQGQLLCYSVPGEFI